MARHTFFCVDAHTCGNPVRVVAGGGAAARRHDHEREAPGSSSRDYDWIRRALMFEPRGHDVMSGSILYPPAREDCDVGVLFIETTRLPADVRPRHHRHGHRRARGGAGHAARGRAGWRSTCPPASSTPSTSGTARYVDQVRLFNVPSYLHAADVDVDVPGLGELDVRRRLWRQLLRHHRAAGELARPRRHLGRRHPAAEPDRAPAGQREIRRRCIPRIRPHQRRQPRHVERQAAQRPRRMRATPSSTARRRSTARPAAPAPRRAWRSSPPRASSRSATISSTRASSAACSTAASRREAKVGNYRAIRPSVAGWARITGHNTIFVDDRDPLAHGFQVV